MRRLKIHLFTVLMLASCVAVVEGQKLPSWLQASAQYQNAEAYKKSDAVILHAEAEMDVSANGRITQSTRYCLKVNTVEGAHYANMLEEYNGKDGKVLNVRIWILKPDLKGNTYGKKDCLDVAVASSGTFYSETRKIAFDGTNRVRVGDIFAYEIEIRHQTIFQDSNWTFHQTIPVRYSILRLKLPTGWDATWHETNEKIALYTVDGSAHAWSALNLEAIDTEEPFLPDFGRLATVLWVRFHPPANASAKIPYLKLHSWNDCAVYFRKPSDAAALPDQAVMAKARELCAGLETDWERIVAISRFVQGVNYLHVATDLSIGGGYAAAKAGDVLKNHYGDCKDKTALMRALLQTVGIDSRAVAARIGNDIPVDPDFPGPFAFDHQIVAVRVGDDIESAPVVVHPELGRLFFFDPTDEFTMPGDLSTSLQGSEVLVFDDSIQRTIRLPYIGGDLNSDHRQISAEITSVGHLYAQVQLDAVGQEAVYFFSSFRKRSASAYRDFVRDWIHRGSGVANFGDVVVDDQVSEGRFNLKTEFAVPHYAKPIGHEYFVFNPAIFARRSWVPAAGERKNPLLFRPSRFTETVEFQLPQGFAVDEVGSDISLSESFGEYTATIEVEPDRVIFRRSFQINAIELTADAYPGVREFYRKMVETEQKPVVLKRM